jgi:U-box domain
MSRTSDILRVDNVSSLLETARILGADVPPEFICPITLDVMKNPILTRSGMSYERAAIIHWLQNGSNTCPLTRKSLSMTDLISNKALKDRIDFWTWANDIPVSTSIDEYRNTFSILVTNMRKVEKKK